MNPFSVFTRKTAFLIRILLCIAAAAALLAWPAAAAQGMTQGVTLCLETLVPSLFPFMVLAEYLSASGLGEAAGKHLHRLSRRLFALPGAAAPVIVLAFLGGYPVGAVGAAGLLRRGLLTQKETRRLMALCCLPRRPGGFCGDAPPWRLCCLRWRAPDSLEREAALNPLRLRFLRLNRMPLRVLWPRPHAACFCFAPLLRCLPR